MSRVALAPAAKLPPPGTAAVEVIAADFQHPAGERAVRQVCGNTMVRELRRRGTRWVGVVCGRGGIFVLPFDSEVEFLEIGASALDICGYLAGPLVLLPFGGPAIREKLIAAARKRELETADAEGHA